MQTKGICDLNGLGAARDICQTQDKTQRNRIGCILFYVLATLRSASIYFTTASDNRLAAGCV